MKTIQMLVLALLVMVGLSRPFAADAADVLLVDALASTTTQLNIRSGPSTNNRILRSIPASAYVLVQSGPYNGAWYAVSFAGVSGFVHGGYLQQRMPTARLSEATATAPTTLRAGPGASYDPVGAVQRGARVTIDARPEAEGWRKITIGEVTGYSMSQGFVRYLGNGGPKRVVVDISEQWLYAYEGDDLILTVPVSTGRDDFDTPIGVHRVQWKAALRTMTGTSNGETWEVKDVPHAMYLTSTGVALHGTYWHRLFGSGARPSHGCINLPMDSAAVLFDWIQIATPVEVRE